MFVVATLKEDITLINGDPFSLSANKMSINSC